MRPYVQKNRQMRPSNAVRTVWDAEAIDTSHLGFRPIQKIATIHASSGFIRGIPIEGPKRTTVAEKPEAARAQRYFRSEAPDSAARQRIEQNAEFART